MDQEPSLYSIKGLAIVDQDGNRLLARYYDSSMGGVKEQRAFEKSLFAKTHKANAEIILLDGLICVYRSNVDLFFYVMGSANENELLLVSVLNCLYDSVSAILRKNVEKKALLDSMDQVLLAVDEIVDGGVVLETEASAVTSRLALRHEAAPNLETLSEQSVADVGMKLFNSTKEQLKWSLLK